VLLSETIVISRGLGQSPAVTYLNDARQTHKSIKEIELIIPFGKWVHNYPKGHLLVLLMNDIINWVHEGLMVNITTGRDGMKKQYTKDHPSFDVLVEPDEYPIDRTRERLYLRARAIVVPPFR
jgi:hypothetical protein